MNHDHTTIKATVPIWLNKYSGPEELKDKDARRIVSRIGFYHPTDADFERGMKEWAALGYVHVGEADVTLRIVDQTRLVESKVESLREEARMLRAETQAKLTDIDARIQQLLAIECTPAGASL